MPLSSPAESVDGHHETAAIIPASLPPSAVLLMVLMASVQVVVDLLKVCDHIA